MIFFTNEYYAKNASVVNSTTLRTIRGKGYSKMLKLLVHPTPQPPISHTKYSHPCQRKSLDSRPLSKASSRPTDAYKLNLVSYTSPSFPSKSLSPLEISKISIINHNRYTHQAAYFPKRSLHCMLNKYSNYKSASIAPNDDSSILVSKMKSSPNRSITRQARYPKEPKRELERKATYRSISSSDIWDSLDAKNINFDYL